MIDIHALQVFYEASRNGSFTAAGHVLNMTQPAVSMQIKSLEEYLQVKLFVRDGRHMRLTKTGQALVPLAQQLIELNINTEQVIRDSNGQVVGDLVIGCSAPSATYVLPHLIARFQRLYPNVRVSMPVVSHEELVEKLHVGGFDFGVMSVIERCQHVTCVPFFQDQIVLIAPASHPFAAKGKVAPAELLAERFICQDRQSACRYAVGEAFEAFGVDINQFDIGMEIGTPEAIVMAVEHGMGLSFVSMLNAAPRVALGRLAILEVEGVTLHTSIHLGYSTSRVGAPVQTKFRDFVRHPQTQSFVGLLTEGRIT